MSGCSGHLSHSSAAGLLQPYGIRVALQLTTRELEPCPFLMTLLEDLAASCLESGASVIGHLKCLLHRDHGVLACNLTSAREGARCSLVGLVPSGSEAGKSLEQPLGPGQETRLDLAVLVYGVTWAVVDDLVRATLSRLLGTVEGRWTLQAGGDESRDM